MRKINNLLQSPFRWFLPGFLITPIFVLGCVIGNSGNIQALFHPYGSVFKSTSQSYADQILKAGYQSRLNRSLVSLKSDQTPPMSSEGIKVAGVTEGVQISEHRVNRLNKEDAMLRPALLEGQDLIRQFPQIPLWKDDGQRASSIEEFLLYSTTGAGQPSPFEGMDTSSLDSQQNFAVVRVAPEKHVDIPIPVLKNEFLQRTKHYYGANLTYKERMKEHQCLAIGIYFEARGEPKRGQLAVAQVIINRVKERFYPNSICKVVWQGSERQTGCQFSFTCDGLSDKPLNQRKWRLAKILARNVMDGKVWLDDIGNASHYHATYVSPRWKRDMWHRKQIGLHIFYRGKFLHKTSARSTRRVAHRRRSSET